ncbi:MAG: hypothetical protein JRG84_16580 [Deltaproteobacteria bacterium]|nr:hypothetical protein [Deltaproteobacteria bacterium]
MLIRNVWIRAGLGLALVVLAAGPASAGTAYRYTAADGSLAFTDDLERVPAQQRSSTEVIQTGPLGAYARLTPEQAGQRSEQAEQAYARLERLRALRASLAVEEIRSGATVGSSGPRDITGYEATVEVKGSTIRLPAMGGGDEPLIVEEVRSKPYGQIVTRRSTIIRRGDEILMVVRGEQENQTNVSDFYDERELDAGTWRPTHR